MHRSLVLHQIDMDDIATMERWYYLQHSAEIARRYGPWLCRHESWMPVPAPEDAKAYGFFNWRLTQTYWREEPLPGPRGELAFTPSPVPLVRCASTHIPAQCTEDFKGYNLLPYEKENLRWVQFIRYPDGVDKERADRWYVEVMAPAVCKHHALHRFFSSKTIQVAGGLPGVWREQDRGRLKSGKDRQWDRVSEMWFESFRDWRDFVTHAPEVELPDWAQQTTFPYLNCGDTFISTFVVEQPTNDFLAEKRVYL